MPSFKITNSLTGQDLGTWTSESALDAYQAMVRERHADKEEAESAGLWWWSVPGDILVQEIRE